MGRKNKKVQYTWRVFWAGPAALQQILIGNAASLATATNVRNLVTAAELEDLDDSALVKRVVGTFYFFFQNDTDPAAALGEWSLHAGIYLAEEGTAIAPTSAVLAQDISWSWLRQWSGTGSGIANEGGNYARFDQSTGYVSASIDVGINRRMREGDELKFAVAASCVSGADTWNVFEKSNLRILLEV